MDPERFQKVRELFAAALERKSDVRDAFVSDASQGDAELRAEVFLLLEAQDRTITLRQSDSRRVPAISHAQAGRRLGDYEIVRSIGRGGMGAVYLARRADDAFHKLVAIKILRADSSTSDLLNRFQREREILAQLEHPNIARLLDAGETDDGLPYFVMEYVEGRAITNYADDLRLTMRDRIELFRQVCNAVEYAHQHKIVHRDLKPGNILVTAEGQVKLLDFGIARLVRQEAGPPALTQTGLWLMTPEYASPEQVRGEPVGRASDVYSLGVILFELLTGHRPYHLRNRIFHEIVRVICEDPPTRPSVVIAQAVETVSADGKPSTFPPDTAGKLRQTSLDELRRELSGDIDHIVLKTLDKDAAERYGSCRELDQDLRRHLEGLPVSAEGASRRYLAGKFISRYRWWVAAALVLLIATATGAVQMTPFAALMASGVLWVLALRYHNTRREFGQRVASQMTFGMFVLFAAISVAGWAIETLGFNLGTVTAILGAGVAVYYVLLLARWLTRERWAGALLLRTNRPKSANWKLMVGLSVILANLLVVMAIGWGSGQRQHGSINGRSSHS